VRVQRHTAHFGAVEVLPEILAWLIDEPAHPVVRTDAGR
jgi:hypothetical protein